MFGWRSTFVTSIHPEEGWSILSKYRCKGKKCVSSSFVTEYTCIEGDKAGNVFMVRVKHCTHERLLQSSHDGHHYNWLNTSMSTWMAFLVNNLLPSQAITAGSNIWCNQSLLACSSFTCILYTNSEVDQLQVSLWTGSGWKTHSWKGLRRNQLRVKWPRGNGVGLSSFLPLSLRLILDQRACSQVSSPESAW